MGEEKERIERIINMIQEITEVYKQQYEAWMSRNAFERQWVLKDFKKVVGISAEQCKQDLLGIEEQIENKKLCNLHGYKNLFEKLEEYFKHQYKMLQGFEKNQDKLKESGDSILGWVSTLDSIINNI